MVQFITWNYLVRGRLEGLDWNWYLISSATHLSRSLKSWPINNVKWQYSFEEVWMKYTLRRWLHAGTWVRMLAILCSIFRSRVRYVRKGCAIIFYASWIYYYSNKYITYYQIGTNISIRVIFESSNNNQISYPSI